MLRVASVLISGLQVEWVRQDRAGKKGEMFDAYPQSSPLSTNMA